MHACRGIAAPARPQADGNPCAGDTRGNHDAHRSAAKARGVELGSFGKVLAAKNAAAAAERDDALRPILAELAGMSANAITAALNERGVPTPRGGPWHAMSVIRVQRRLGIA